ncbi:U2 small nuclear ribonucleoprotein auxiliary factor 35 kDa subunit-related protein 1-like [Gymnodraco acuticeps]|uniref:U2 small nuclear ribonucleoprotein auxiliary factor 35 kDa subunit-related protein 1-like n=1 Tax=Gymnodraco acuticeps TaxID=8218 RepID=A0A6P8UVC1_GYMAC|nr:U2 small nuclear ribonucleoprotein auxiliary factor 35 kDa subunit-related protein 1-like [Gymnodraco acuticeps]XP_034081755.1 U2 small nuclear ribonucleoprotein auxiliary factor 35 kDa subunit-related protein 1-like [Gymnodraco acuticeps]
MTHNKRFQGIPMSKSMRGLCKVEDYEFLGLSENMRKDGIGGSENNFRGKQEDRARRKQEREQLEKKRLQEIEDSKKVKEEQWKTHVQELTSSQEKILQERLARLKTFREFQRKVLVEESGMEDREAGLTASQLLTRM